MARKSPTDSSPSEGHGFVVGLTGGIGSGKTAVADLFGELGACLVDTDSIAHSITAPGGAAIGAIAEVFGGDYLTADGALDRSRMRQLVFSDSSAKKRLEAILHPRIRELAWAQTLAGHERAPYVVLVVPLLVESGTWRDRVDRLLVIDCARSTQEARVSARSRLDPILIRGIIAQQATRNARLDAADDVLVNDGPLEWLAPRVARLHRRYCEHARRTHGRL